MQNKKIKFTDYFIQNAENYFSQHGKQNLSEYLAIMALYTLSDEIKFYYDLFHYNIGLKLAKLALNYYYAILENNSNLY